MIIEKVFSVLQAVAFNHQYVEITYTNSMGYTKKATGRLEIERNWCYLYLLCLILQALIQTYIYQTMGWVLSPLQVPQATYFLLSTRLS